MTTDQKQEPQAQLLSALRAAEAVIEDVTDTLRSYDGEPVTAFTDSEEIERVYLLMTGVLVEIDEVIRAATPHPVSLVLGEVVMTPGALDALSPRAWLFRRYLDRHQSGDWGCVCPEDAEVNFEAVREGNRVLSAYPIDPEAPCKGYGENCVWIITEADRSVTTFLLPDEY